MVLFCLSLDKLGTVMKERERERERKRRPGFVEKWGWVIKKKIKTEKNNMQDVFA